MAGDALIHDSIYKDSRTTGDNYDFSSIFTNINDKIKNYDLAFYNQETIIGGKNLGLSSYPRFNTPDEFANLMVGIGFNVVSLANNHSMDKNEAGILYSNNYWATQKGVITSGTNSSFEEQDNIKIAEKNGIKYAMIAYTTLTNGLNAPRGKEYLVNIYSNERARRDIEQVRDKVDVLMVSMHWGVEYTNTPTQNQKDIATYLSSLGVDIIIGHHPHVIQPIEYIGNTIVFYSLGNFVSAQVGSDKLTGLIASIDITKTELDGNITINYSDITADLIYTYYNRFREFKIIPYTNINASYLPNYLAMYNKYEGILKSKTDKVMLNKIIE